MGAEVKEENSLHITNCRSSISPKVILEPCMGSRGVG
jgi:hypothetical protein